MTTCWQPSLHSDRFANTAQAGAHATQFDEGRHIGSLLTIYRLLDRQRGTLERRRQLTHPTYAKPGLLALPPKQMWTWDITRLKGPVKWTCSHLYVILDIFGRHVMCRMLAERGQLGDFEQR